MDTAAGWHCCKEEKCPTGIQVLWQNCLLAVPGCYKSGGQHFHRFHRHQGWKGPWEIIESSPLPEGQEVSWGHRIPRHSRMWAFLHVVTHISLISDVFCICRFWIR
uniref:Uncharacterized protein n=1 Tax=Crocodylus porosus TaxID=8502 RepID=A0A7M4EQ92_CROPO